MVEKKDLQQLIEILKKIGYTVEDKRANLTGNYVDINDVFHPVDHELNADIIRTDMLGVGIFVFERVNGNVITNSYAFHEKENLVIGTQRVMPEELFDLMYSSEEIEYKGTPVKCQSKEYTYLSKSKGTRPKDKLDASVIEQYIGEDEQKRIDRIKRLQKRVVEYRVTFDRSGNVVSSEKIGGSISFQLIDIFNILEDSSKSEEQKRVAIKEYQQSLTQDIKQGGRGIPYGSSKKYVPNMKNGYYVFGDIDIMSYEDLVKTKEYVDANLDSFTCEVEMKMPALIKGYDRESHNIIYNFGLAEKVYNYALSHGKDMRGHTLVYGKHCPKALDEYIADRLGCTVEELEAQSKNPTEEFIKQRKELTKSFLTDYIKTVGEHFPNCNCWDVMNEIVADVHTPKPTEEERKDGLKHSKWFEYLGKDWYIDVLEIARDNLPAGTKLFYNDYGEENPEKRKAIIQLINNIKKHEEKTGKVLLDGIGLQSHYNIDITEQQLEEIYKDFATTGKEIQVTEMDITPGEDENGKHRKYQPENMPKYKKIWNKVFELTERYGIKAFTGWGINDALSWHRNIGCTMVEKDGTIKEWAKDFFDRKKQRRL